MINKTQGFQIFQTLFFQPLKFSTSLFLMIDWLLSSFPLRRGVLDTTLCDKVGQ
jgi:hypothetical protein